MAKAKRSTTKKTTARKPRRGGAFDLDAALAALPASAATTPPSVAVATLLQEASDVAQAAAKHASKLRKLPFDHSLLATLPARRDALAKAETAWRSARAKGAAKTAKSIDDATKLRSEIIAAGRYLLRDDAAAQRELDDIAEGDGLADLVSDLDALAAFATSRRDALAAATMRGGIGKAIDSARSLADAIRASASDRRTDTSASDAVGHRNRCAQLVERALREVRAAARYALRGDDRALKPFRSAELAARRRARKSGAAPTPTPTPGGGSPPSA